MDAYYALPQEELMKRVGNISQIAGAKRYFLADGRGFGTECVDVRTGSGFEYTVMPGRGMDIGWCGYKGIPISYISKVGASAPAYFTGVKDQWRQCFPGGLLSTCGLGNVGSFCIDENEGIGAQAFGQHGRISNQCARNICVSERWDAGVFRIAVSGEVSEAQLRAEHFTLKRTVSSYIGAASLVVEDEITNEDYVDRPCLYLYHMNFGFPILEEGARILTSPMEEYIRNEYSSEDQIAARRISAPIHGMKERLFFYRSGNKTGRACAAIVTADGNLLVYVRYSAETLPYLTEWKLMAEADYVVGLEAGNCIPKGRAWYREKDALPTLAARTSLRTRLEIGIIEGSNKLREFISLEQLK